MKTFRLVLITIFLIPKISIYKLEYSFRIIMVVRMVGHTQKLSLTSERMIEKYNATKTSVILKDLR